MFTAHITITVKGYERGAEWRNATTDTETADTLPELREILQKRYPTSSWRNKKPMYRDKPDGTSVRSGWIVGFRSEMQDRSADDGVYRHLQQDWISITEDKSRRLDWPINGRSPL